MDALEVSQPPRAAPITLPAPQPPDFERQKHILSLPGGTDSHEIWPESCRPWGSAVSVCGRGAVYPVIQKRFRAFGSLAKVQLRARKAVQ